MTLFYHTPVLVAEVIDALGVRPGGRYIDATIGGGGHAVEIMRRGGAVLGIDTDREAIEHIRQRVEDEAESLDKNKITLVNGNFKEIEDIAKREGFDKADGVLFDLGVSSHQLDTPGRGFSYRFADAPLDMRLDQAKGSTAAELIAQASVDELYEIFTKFAEEERARAIAHAIVRARSVAPITTTGDLMAILSKAVRSKRELPEVASRVFQAIRIGINDELESLKSGLIGAKNILGSGGRLVVISFHSLEDRMVKRFFRYEGLRELSKKPVTASQAERGENSRARSAKLRIAEKI